MTQVTTATQTQSQTQPAATKQNAAKISSDFETFLRMLTVQMKNQDPLNPIESADYAVQLATFSGVEQQVRTNDLLRSIGSGLKSNGLHTLSNWIGREIPATGPAHFDGSPLSLVIGAGDEATRIQIEVYDERNQVVQRFDVPSDAKQFEWAGRTADGSPVPSGNYRFKTVAWAGSKPLAHTDTPVYQLVTEVRSGSDGGELILAAGHSVKAKDVSSLRQAHS